MTNLFTWRDAYSTQISSTCYTYQKDQFIGLGRVKLLEDGDQLAASFDRFPGDEVNGYTEQKMEYIGQEGEVVEVYDNQTVSIVFDDGTTASTTLDFPVESIMNQVSTSIVTGLDFFGPFGDDVASHLGQLDLVQTELGFNKVQCDAEMEA